jgi:hypothetical protein
MKTMASHISATLRETPHPTDNSISDVLKRRAQSIMNNKSIDAGTRALIGYALEVNDASLSELVRRVDAGETIIDNLNLSETSEDERCQEKIEALVELICRADDSQTKPAALLILMATLENSTEPKALANAAKHFVFTHCGELNLYSMVDSQIAAFEDKLLHSNPFVH